MTGHVLSPHEVITRGILVDNLVIGAEGITYLAGLQDNIVIRVFMNRTQHLVAGHLNSTVLMLATSAAFGRKPGAGNRPSG